MTSSAMQPLEKVWHLLRRPSEIWPLFRSYLGFGRRLRQEPVVDVTSLAQFLESRASFVAQTSLYGYLRTRAGQRYPQLFEDLHFVQAVNIAKWQIWLACLSDLSVYAGGLLTLSFPGKSEQVARLMSETVERVLAATGIPADSGPEFNPSAEAVRRRVATCDWRAIADDEGAFSESPAALIKWAPIVDQLKALDEPIVINSVRFRWQGIRRDLRESLRVETILESWSGGIN
jgi:hypothetical protein